MHKDSLHVFFCILQLIDKEDWTEPTVFQNGTELNPRFSQNRTELEKSIPYIANQIQLKFLDLLRRLTTGTSYDPTGLHGLRAYLEHTDTQDTVNSQIMYRQHAIKKYLIF